MSVASLTFARVFLATGEPAHFFQFLDDEGRVVRTSKNASMLRVGKRGSPGGRTVHIRVAVEDLPALRYVLPPAGLEFVVDAITARLEGQRR